MSASGHIWWIMRLPPGPYDDISSLSKPFTPLTLPYIYFVRQRLWVLNRLSNYIAILHPLASYTVLCQFINSGDFRKAFYFLNQQRITCLLILAPHWCLRVSRLIILMFITSISTKPILLAAFSASYSCVIFTTPYVNLSALMIFALSCLPCFRNPSVAHLLLLTLHKLALQVPTTVHSSWPF